MKIFTFLDSSYEVLETVKAQDYLTSLEKVKNASIDIHTPYYSEYLKESEYYN